VFYKYISNSLFFSPNKKRGSLKVNDSREDVQSRAGARGNELLRLKEAPVFERQCLTDTFITLLQHVSSSPLTE